jgi:hypothetical protein
MKKNFTNSFPQDEVVICDSAGDCIEAAGQNAKQIVGGVMFVLLCLGVFYLAKALK